MAKGNTTLIQKDPLKGTAPNDYRPITRLLIMWKIPTAQIREEIYDCEQATNCSPSSRKDAASGATRD